MKCTLYGIKNAANVFLKLSFGIMDELRYKQNCRDPCLYYRWDLPIGLFVWLSFIDDMLVLCNKLGMTQTKEKFIKVVDCDDIGPMQEYIRTKIDADEKPKFKNYTTAFLVQSLKNKFKFREENAKPEVPAVAGTHLVPNRPKLHREEQTKYCSGIRKLLYLMKWSHPELAYSVHELTRFMTQAYPVCIPCLYEGYGASYATCVAISRVWDGHAPGWSLGWVQRL